METTVHIHRTAAASQHDTKQALQARAADDRLAKQCATLNMTADELKAVLGINANWPFPASEDGWVKIHNCVRLDMDEILTAITKTVQQLESKQALAPWQISHFQKYYALFYQNVHNHHDHEEDGFFPWIQSRVQVPEKMSDDHVTLMAQMDRCRDILAGLKSTQPIPSQALAFCDLQATFSTFRSHMRDHLQEEEDVGLPLMRKHFTAAELKVAEKKILKDLTPADLAYFLWPIQGITAKRAIMTDFGIPTLIQRLLMEPAIRKDERTRQRMMRELKAGQRDVAQKAGWFSCLA